MINFRKRTWLQLLFVVPVLILAACSPVVTPVEPESMVQTIVAATVAAIPTSTKAPEVIQPTIVERIRVTDFPTFTPVATITPFPTATETATLPVPTETPSPMPLGGREVGKIQGRDNYSCQIVYQKPDDWVTFKPGDIILVTWSVKNTGVKDWPIGSLDVIHLGGTKMYLYNDEKKNEIGITAGDVGDVAIWIKAPEVSDEYSVEVGLRRGDKVFCRLNFQMIVR